MLLSQGVQTRCDVARCSVDRGRCNPSNADKTLPPAQLLNLFAPGDVTQSAPFIIQTEGTHEQGHDPG
jgi:hypothetical protein